ncbi:hypothetical protein [Chryseobacterium artocarpi]|uniref:hypothetical protein n=1 Tax=Chryseobacterium artocarpi TaxID=1414727 RepID=UPI003F3D905A
MKIILKISLKNMKEHFLVAKMMLEEWFQGNYLQESDFSKRRLSKLTRDIVESKQKLCIENPFQRPLIRICKEQSIFSLSLFYFSKENKKQKPPLKKGGL